MSVFYRPYTSVLASSPENVLFVLGVGVEWDEQSLAVPRQPLCRQAPLHTPQSLFGTRYYERTRLNTSPDRREGSLLTPPTQCCVLGRHHGCGRVGLAPTISRL